MCCTYDVAAHLHLMYARAVCHELCIQLFIVYIYIYMHI